jgi:TorA maturation chaperone TorD
MRHKNRDMARTAGERGNVYALLAVILRRPISPATLRTIRLPAFAQALSQAGVELGEDFAAAAEDQLLERLVIDFTQLFHGPRGHVPPFESVQTGGRGESLNARAASRVRRFFESAGFEFNDACGELSDHIGVELEFMAELTHREADAWETDDVAALSRCLEDQRDFLKKHLGAWGPELGRSIRDKAQSRLYRGIGQLLAAFLESERVEVDRRLEIGAAQEAAA